MVGGTVSDCANRVSIVGGDCQIGGIVGMSEAGKVINCTNYGTIEGEYRVGGMVGYNAAGRIEKCMSNATIQAKYVVGGMTGRSESTGMITECYNLGSIISTGSVADGESSGAPLISPTGGIVGNSHGTITRCVNSGTITALKRVVGGIAGRNNEGTVSYCCNLGNVTGEMVVGGIAGNNRGSIMYVYNRAEEIKITVGGGCDVGGIAGNQNTNNNAYVKYAYNTAKVTAKNGLGGIAGNFVIGKIDRTYNLGILNTTATTDVGQIAGGKYNVSAITNSSGTTESEMKGWSQATISTNLGQFVKKENSLPILNITVRDITF